jgi:hypothetical protein
MVRRIVVAGVLACTLALTGTAVAKEVPRAKLASDADLVCSAANGKLVQYTGTTNFVDPGKATTAQVKAYGPWLVWSLKIMQDKVRRFKTLGTPREAAARAAWTRYLVLHSTIAVPGFARGAAAAMKGDGKGLVAAFTRIEKYGGEARRLEQTLGLHVCRWSS